jgi:hypothetical protein
MATAIRVASDKEGKGNEAGNGAGNKGGLQQREQWLWQKDQLGRGWRVSDGDKGDGDGDGDNAGNGNGDKAGG